MGTGVGTWTSCSLARYFIVAPSGRYLVKCFFAVHIYTYMIPISVAPPLSLDMYQSDG